MEDFINYVLSFYGAGTDSVYPEMAFTREEVEAGLVVLQVQYREFYGDSLDRERLRDIVLKTREVDRAFV